MGLAAAAAAAVLAGLLALAPASASGQDCSAWSPPRDERLSSDAINLFVNAYPFAEVDATHSVTVTARLNGHPLPEATTVALSIASSSTATAGEDYETPTLPTITIPCNSKQGSATFDFTVKADNAIDAFYETVDIDGDHDYPSGTDLPMSGTVAIAIQDDHDGAPSRIGSVVATRASAPNSITLSWSAPPVPNPADPVNEYRMLRHHPTDGHNGIRITVSATDACTGTACTYTDEDLLYSTTYTYSVRAINNAGWSPSTVANELTTGTAGGL